MSEFGDGIWKSQIRQDKINRYKPASLRFFEENICVEKIFKIKRSTGPRPTARLFEPIDDDIFHVRIDYENQVVRMGCRFLLNYFLR